MNPRRILIIEDDLGISKIVALRLRASGYEVLTCEDGEYGYDLARVEKPDVIILDSMLPGMSGLEIARALKASKEYEYISIIMLTAQSSEENRRRAREAGVSSIVTKPFDSQILLRHVGDHFQSLAA